MPKSLPTMVKTRVSNKVIITGAITAIAVGIGFIALNLPAINYTLPPNIVSFSATPSTIDLNGTMAMSYTVENAVSCYFYTSTGAFGGGWKVSNSGLTINGTKNIKPFLSGYLEIYCTNYINTAKKRINVTVLRYAVTYPDSYNITWKRGTNQIFNWTNSSASAAYNNLSILLWKTGWGSAQVAQNLSNTGYFGPYLVGSTSVLPTNMNVIEAGMYEVYVCYQPPAPNNTICSVKGRVTIVD